MGKRLHKISVPVTGMSCAACRRRVEEALAGTAGMVSANVNLATEKATVEYDAARVGIGALIRAVEDAGYGVEKRESSFGVTGMSCAGCVASVEKALQGVPGVVDASVNLAAERATVEYLAGTAGGKISSGASKVPDTASCGKKGSPSRTHVRSSTGA